MLERGQERYSEEMLADPRNPRVLLAKMIGDAVRENLGDPPLNRERLEQAVREAQKQGDMLIVLALTLHDHVRPKLIVAHTELLEERFIRILSQTSLLGHWPKSWELWRAQLTDSLIEKLRLKRSSSQSVLSTTVGTPCSSQPTKSRLTRKLPALTI